MRGYGCAVEDEFGFTASICGTSNQFRYIDGAKRRKHSRRSRAKEEEEEAEEAAVAALEASAAAEAAAAPEAARTGNWLKPEILDPFTPDKRMEVILTRLLIGVPAGCPRDYSRNYCRRGRRKCCSIAQSCDEQSSRRQRHGSRPPVACRTAAVRITRRSRRTQCCGVCAICSRRKCETCVPPPYLVVSILRRQLFPCYSP